MCSRDTTNPAVARLLEAVHRLFTLRRIAQHGTALLRADGIGPNELSGIPDTIERTIAELVGGMDTLVEAFDLPDAVMDTIPITRADYGTALLDAARA